MRSLVGPLLLLLLLGADVFADRFQVMVLLLQVHYNGCATSVVADVMVWPAYRGETIVYRRGRAAGGWIHRRAGGVPVIVIHHRG